MVIWKEEKNPLLKIAVCDDEKDQLEKLTRLVEEAIDGQRIIKTYASAKELLAVIKEREEKAKQPFDMIFCDIRMPELDGIEFGKSLREITPKSFLVFITAYEEYAILGYKARAFRYLLKPVTPSDLREVLEDMKKEKGENRGLLIKTPDREQFLSLDEILYIRAEDKYTVLYTQKGHFVERTSLQELEDMLKNHGFFRIHRSYLINCCYHKNLGRGRITLSTGDRLPISRRREAAYKERLLLGSGKGILS